jgi:multiple sugar transport system ATP-binding protein
MTMGRRIALLNQGVLQQVGTPLEVYEQPANRFVASFIGTPPMNFLPDAVSAKSASGRNCDWNTSGAGCAGLRSLCNPRERRGSDAPGRSPGVHGCAT